MSANPDPRPNTGSLPTETRRHLLTAAAAVFAERGFREATIREICQRADANVAAVNYHFGDKEGLYEEVLRACQDDPHNPRSHLELDPSAPVATRLEAYVRWMFRRVLASDQEAQMGQLLSREMIEPTPALGRIVEVHLRPEARWLGRVMRELLGPYFSHQEVARAAMGVVGQIVFYKHCRSLLGFLDPDLLPKPDNYEAHVRQITDFTLAGAERMRARRETETDLAKVPLETGVYEPFEAPLNRPRL